MCHRFDPGTVLDLLHERGCTTTLRAITAYIALLEHPKFDPSRLGRFRKLFSWWGARCGGRVQRWEKATGVYIHNAYGLTETTSPSHLVPLGRAHPLDSSTGTDVVVVIREYRTGTLIVTGKHALSPKNRAVRGGRAEPDARARLFR